MSSTYHQQQQVPAVDYYRHAHHYSYQQPLPQYPPPPLHPHHHHQHNYSTNTFFQPPPPPPPPALQALDFYQQPNYNYPPPPQLPPILQQQQQQQLLLQLPNLGGVSEVLDYNIDEIVKFLTLLSVNIFTNYNIKSSSSLESKLKNVITATRLPKSSILLSILYLSNKVAASKNIENDIYTNVIISLLLANKFNDDSTFTNKSWSSASGLDIKLISRLEIEFLVDLNYNLKSIMEDPSFKILENSFDDWCLNNKQQQQQDAIIAATSTNNTAVAPQLSPLESHHHQFVSSSPPPYYNYQTAFNQQQLPTPTSTKFNGDSFIGNKNLEFSSSPISNPYNNQYYGYYNNTDYVHQQQQQQQHQQRLQQQQQLQVGYYYGLNDQFVPCY